MAVRWSLLPLLFTWLVTCGECAVVFSRIMRQQEVSVSGSRVPSTLQHVCRVRAMVGTLPPPSITLHHLASPCITSPLLICSVTSSTWAEPGAGLVFITRMFFWKYLNENQMANGRNRYNFAKPRCMMPIGNRYRSIIEAPLTSRLARSGQVATGVIIPRCHRCSALCPGEDNKNIL